MARSSAVVLICSAVAFAAPAAASGQEPEPATPETAAPATGTLALQLKDAGRRRTVVAGDRFSVRGTLKPYVAAQRVTVRFREGAHALKTRRLKVHKVRGADAGRFAVSLTTKGSGRIRATASHAATGTLATVRASAKPVVVLPSSVGPGSASSSVRALQAQLSGHGYVVGAKGAWDARTARAVLALRKVLGLGRTTSADGTVMRALAAGRGDYPVRHEGHGRHVEASIAKQVVALIGTGGKVERIYTTSSGKPSTPTVRGSFRFYRKDAGTNAEGMVDAAYFIRGYAIHGYHDVPTYNASHGCLRVPIPDARAIFDWVRLGEQIDVYR